MLTIHNLNDRKDAFDVVCQWIYDEFIVGQRDGVTYSDIETLFRESLDTNYPLTLVAESDGKYVGTVSLVKEDEIKNCPYTPWLASLYVLPEYRNRGIARILMDRCADAARDLGFKDLYLRTEHADKYYESLGWERVEACIDQYGLDTRIYKTALKPARLNIGCHLSVSRGYAHMGKEALSINANTFQYFSRNPRGGAAKKVEPDDIAALRDICKREKFAKLLVHAPYTLNPCSADEKVRDFAYRAMSEDLETLELLPYQLYNFHPGSHVGQGIDTGIDLICDLLNRVLTPTMKTTVLLETMAGKGSEVGGHFEELRRILDGLKYPEKVGVCMDTCHIHDGGYDIVNNLDGVLCEFDRIIGLNKLCAIHLNDSLNENGAKKDRHAKIGEGKIGLDAIVRIINHPKLSHLPFYLETPNELDGYAAEIECLRSHYIV